MLKMNQIMLYKITTEETNYDDVYTITIKIDKRNFL